MPFGELMTGIESFLASAVSSTDASESVTPWPMKSTGRCEARIMSSARATSSFEAPLRRDR